MFSGNHILSDVARLVKEAADDAYRSVVHSKPSIKGREEDVSSQVAHEITEHLLERVASGLHGRTLDGVRFSSYTVKKSEEAHAGADILGILKLHAGRATLIKAFLAQAKVGTYKPKSLSGRTPRIYAREARLLGQCMDMLKLTSDSFVFVYTPQGAFVFPAFAVALSQDNFVCSHQHFYKSFGTFWKEFLKCFIGDHQILGRIPTSCQDLRSIADMFGAENAIIIEADAPLP